MITDREAVVEALRARLEPQAVVLDAYLFGSLARGQAAPHSDVDVAVYLDPAALRQTAYGNAAELGAALQQALGRSDVDLVILNEAPPLLYHRVLRDGVRVLSRDFRATTRREGAALSRYCDYVPQLRKIEEAHRKRIAAGNFGR